MKMKVLSLEYVEPLMPIGFEAAENEADPSSELRSSFQRWLSERNFTLKEMSNEDIYLRLHKIGGVNHNPYVAEGVYQHLLRLRDSQEPNN